MPRLAAEKARKSRDDPPAERRIQVQRLLERFGTKHCVLMGDLNEWFLWGRPLRWIQAIFGGSPAPATFPSAWPVFALDRIWVRPPGTLRPIISP